MNNERELIYDLKNRLQKKNISQKKLADILGKKRENVNKMLNLKNSMTFANLIKLCNAVGIKIMFEDGK
jgi:plasmid maintenance system antidote protein VapI